MAEEPQGPPAGEDTHRNGKAPGLIRNAVSLIGAALAVVAAANIAFLVFVDYISARPSPYIGIFAYMIMPAIMILGLLLIPVGMWVERRRRVSGEPSMPRYPRIDLNDRRQRSAF